jgi:hypothetical protein
MKKKLVLSSLLALGVCSVALATEYKEPEVGFKKHMIPSKEMKVSEFGDHFKVETGVATDRQIASEVESDREPSSIVAKEKKKDFVPEKEEPVEGPKPWLYRTEADRRN